MQTEIYFENDEEDVPKRIRRRKKQLYESIRERMEFYFSDANLLKDRFLSNLTNENPNVDLEVFLKFNKIRQLTDNVHDLKKALKKSDFLALTEDKSKVFRKTPLREKTNVDACTIYVEQLPSDADHDWLKSIFSRYGKVDYVSIPKYRSTGKIKGFAFVEFETPEAANSALEEFEKEGCCLTSHMNPEKLCSIATFEDDIGKCSSNQINDLNKTNKFQGVKLQDENEMKLGKKRKFEENENTQADMKKSKVNISNDSEEKNESEDEESKESSCPIIAIAVKCEADIPVKKKKNRKKKKSLKTKYVKDVKMYGIQILSKPDWKRLRNKYLNVQKEKMKKLKQHLHKSQANHFLKQQHQVGLQGAELQTKPRFTFSEGLIIKVAFEEPVKDNGQVNQFKCDAKTLNKVEYVDITIGSKEAFVRFSDSKDVQEAMQLKLWENMSVLEGTEEKEYWEKMIKDRSEKFENKKKFQKKRGRNKVIDKTEKLMSKRIRLSVDE